MIFFTFSARCNKLRMSIVYFHVFLLFHTFSSLFQHVAISSGSGARDLEKLGEIISKVPGVNFICLDVANGYSEHFVAFVKSVRGMHPNKTIIAGKKGIAVLKTMYWTLR